MTITSITTIITTGITIRTSAPLMYTFLRML